MKVYIICIVCDDGRVGPLIGRSFYTCEDAREACVKLNREMANYASVTNRRYIVYEFESTEEMEAF